MVEYIKYTPETANNWSRAWSETKKQRPWAFRRLLDSSTTSQMQSKLWIATEAAITTADGFYDKALGQNMEFLYRKHEP